jgi:hypothetical protein
MAALFKESLSRPGASRMHTYRAQADLCRRLATAGHLSETRQNLEDIAASYDRLADEIDLVELWRSNRSSGEVERAQRRRSRMRRIGTFRLGD